VHGLKVPRLPTPRLNLKTKGQPAKNPYGANKMTIKTGSLAAYRYEMLLEKQASGQISLREFVQLQEFEKQANLSSAVGAVSGFGRRAVGALRSFGARVKNVFRPSAPALSSPVASVSSAARGASALDPEIVLPGSRALANTNRQAMDILDAPVPGAGASQTALTPLPKQTTLTTPPGQTTSKPPTPDSVDGLLSQVIRAAPIGVAGGLTAYGGFRGWGSGQAEVEKARQQSFNPRGVF